MKYYVVCYELAKDSIKNIHFTVVKANSRYKAREIAEKRINESHRIITLLEGKVEI